MSAMTTTQDVTTRARAELGRGEGKGVTHLLIGDNDVRSPEQVHAAGLWDAPDLRISGWSIAASVMRGAGPRYLTVRLMNHVKIVEETNAYEVRRRDVIDVIFRDDVQVAAIEHFIDDVVSKPDHDVCVWCKYDNAPKNDRDGWNCGHCGGN